MCNLATLGEGQNICVSRNDVFIIIKWLYGMPRELLIFFGFIVFSVLNIRTLCVLYDGDPVVNRKYAGESEHLGYLANGKCASENEH